MLIVTVWATLMAEMWKRKENQIAFLWGFNLTTIHMEKSRRLNPDFIGYKQFNINTGELVPEKEKLYSRIGKALNFVIPLTLIIANIYCYFKIKEKAQEFANSWAYIKCHPQKTKIEAAGQSLVITISTGFFTFIYKQLVNKLIKLENHKHMYGVEDSLTDKLMLFRLINANLPVVFTCG
jgi:hypothetical protein